VQISWRKRISRLIRGKLRARVLSRYGEGILANSRNGLLVVDPRDFNVARSLLRNGFYDWAEVEWLSAILTPESRIVFVGAHIGALLVPIARRSGSRHIVAIEPSPRNHRLLSMNIALNGLQSITLHHVAIGESEGTVRFTENPINSGNSRVSDSGEVEVPASRLDVVLADLSAVDLLIMDIEGFEVRAMRGGIGALAKTRYLYVEYAPEQIQEQGSEPVDFIELLAERYSSMYLPGQEVRFFPDRTYVAYLKGLPDRRGLLLNLLFSNEKEPRAELMKMGSVRATAP
jgi:FkbM family methyltransferase